jgi:hypothetical protein
VSSCFFDSGRKAANDDGKCLGRRVRPWIMRVETFTLALSLLLILTSCAKLSSSNGTARSDGTAKSIGTASAIPLPPPPLPPPPPLARTPAAPVAPVAHAPVAEVQHSGKSTAAFGPVSEKNAPEVTALNTITPGPIAPGTITPSEIAPGTIAKARHAMQDIAKLNQLFTEEMATTSDPKIQGAIYADFEKKYMAALGAEGLSLNTYLHVLAVAAKDPGTAKQLYAPNATDAAK